MKPPKRWVFLKHVCEPSDPRGFHYDLLLEDFFDCRTWRMDEFPSPDGSSLRVCPLPPHKLDWLESSGRCISGGRGWAKPMCSGVFSGCLPEDYGATVIIALHSKPLKGMLLIDQKLCKLQLFPLDFALSDKKLRTP